MSIFTEAQAKAILDKVIALSKADECTAVLAEQVDVFVIRGAFFAGIDEFFVDQPGRVAHQGALGHLKHRGNR